MPLRNMQWHPSHSPFIDITCTPYNDGTVNIIMRRFDAQPGDTNDEARNRVAHVLWEDDVVDDEKVIARYVRSLHNVCKLLRCAPRASQSMQLPLPQPRVWTVPPSKRARR